MIQQRNRVNLRRKPRKRLTVASLQFLAIGLLCFTTFAVVKAFAFPGAEDPHAATAPGRQLLSSGGAREDWSLSSGEITTCYQQWWMLPAYSIGIFYMFVGLALVCDEYFVEALDNLSNFFHLSADVAGATFMAAGSSAPELFTSIADTFLVGDGGPPAIGIGTIIGSAIFNILVIVGLCAIAIESSEELTLRKKSSKSLRKFKESQAKAPFGQKLKKEVLSLVKSYLKLDWWPLMRDSFFYSLSIFTLIAVYVKKYVTWYDALIFLIIYGGYIAFMAVNGKLQFLVKKKLCPLLCVFFQKKKKVEDLQQKMVCKEDDDDDEDDDEDEGEAKVVDTPLEETKIENVKQQDVSPPHSMDSHPHSPSYGERDGSFTEQVIDDQSSDQGRLQKNALLNEDSKESPDSQEDVINSPTDDNKEESTSKDGTTKSEMLANDDDDDDDDDDDLENILTFVLPPSIKGKIMFIITSPWYIIMRFTIPDCRRPRWKKWFLPAFVISIIYIGVMSFFMVDWAACAGNTLHIPPEVMGLTILAAGTSVPDALSSMVVAKQGQGDMAVSNAIGSNVFDILIGLGFPWFLKLIIDWVTLLIEEKKLVNVPIMVVDSSGIIPYTITLFTILIVFVLLIAVPKWRLYKGVGYFFMLIYAGFVVVSLSIDVIKRIFKLEDYAE